MDDLVDLADDLGEDNVRRVLRAVGANAALNAFNRDCEIQFVMKLLRQRVGTDAIRERLIARYGISERTAYYRLADGLKSLQKGRDGCSEDWNDEGSNGGCER